jgi:hypothetical protein
VFLNQNLNNYIKSNKKCKLIFCFNAELIEVVANAPLSENKDQLVYKKLNQIFSNIDLKESFEKKLIIVYAEVIIPENLIQLHQWIARQCCNIENIVLVTTLHSGVEKWYNQYLELYGDQGMQIVDAPWIYIDQYYTIQNSIPSLDKNLINKNLKYYFSYWGGTYPSLERDVVSVILSNLLNGYLSYIGCVSSDSEFNNYLEQLTWFGNRELIDQLLTKKQTTKFLGITNKNLINDYCKGFQFDHDKQSALCPVRETLNDIQYSTITEKTMKAFIHMQIPLPISGVGTVDELTKLGFQFCDIVNYNSFQHEKLFLKRVCLIKDEIIRIQQTYTLKQLEEYILDHKEVFYNNYNLIQQGVLAEQSANAVIAKLKK